ALVTAWSLALFPALPLAAGPATPGQAAAAPQPAATPAPQASPAAPPPSVDGEWPRAYEAPGGRIALYQPQIASWDDQRKMVAYAAVVYEPKGAPKPALGTIKIEARTRVSLEERLVSFTPIQITESSFPTLQKEEMRDVVAAIDKAIPDDDRVIALDRVLAGIDRSQILPKNNDGVKADPPTIFFSTKPALLVSLDGEPIWSPIKENDLKFAVNTNWDLFQHDPTKVFYLRSEKSFLQPPARKGPWTAADKLPESFARLPNDDNWKDVKEVLPGKKLSKDKVPRVFLTSTPAEMILLDGEPKYEPVAGTSLLWVSNTESDVFRMGSTGPVYYLVAGRWFSSPGFEGPWTFATPSMPADFQN